MWPTASALRASFSSLLLLRLIVDIAARCTSRAAHSRAARNAAAGHQCDGRTCACANGCARKRALLRGRHVAAGGKAKAKRDEDDENVEYIEEELPYTQKIIKFASEFVNETVIKSIAKWRDYWKIF